MHPGPTARALQDVEAKRPAHQIRPKLPAAFERLMPIRELAAGTRGIVRPVHWSGSFRRLTGRGAIFSARHCGPQGGHDPPAPAGARPEHAVVQDEVHTRARGERRQPHEEFDGVEQQMGRPSATEPTTEAALMPARTGASSASAIPRSSCRTGVPVDVVACAGDLCGIVLNRFVIPTLPDPYCLVVQ